MLVRKSLATPRYAADKGLLLRDTERDIATRGVAFASCLRGGGRGRQRRWKEHGGVWGRRGAASRYNEGVGNRRVMRNGQNKRMRGRNNHRKSHNPMVRVYESNGPDVKIRGNPSHIAEKY